MAKTKVHCTKDLSGVSNNLKAGSKYILSFDGKESYVEEIPATGTSVFVDGELADITPVADKISLLTDAGFTDITPTAGNIVVIDSTGVTEVTPIADGTIDTATTPKLVTVSGIITDATA